MGVTRGGHHAERLVYGIDDACLGPVQGVTVNRHAAVLAHVAGRVQHDLPVDAHAPAGDHRLGRAPRSDTGVG